MEKKNNTGERLEVLGNLDLIVSQALLGGGIEIKTCGGEPRWWHM